MYILYCQYSLQLFDIRYFRFILTPIAGNSFRIFVLRCALNAGKTVSMLKERLKGERRVLLSPEGAATLCRAHIDLMVESNAGIGLGFTDDDYRRVGCRIVDRSIAWKSDVVIKYKAPVPSEFKYFRAGAVIAAVMHAEGDMILTEALLTAGMTSYAFEFFRNWRGKFPLMTAGSTIAGYQALLFGVQHLQSHLGGRGLLLASERISPRVRVLVIGSGNVGAAAADLAVRMGAEVTVLCSCARSLELFRKKSRAGINMAVNEPKRLRLELERSDLVIGAILVSTFDTPVMISEDMVRSMKRGSVIVDATAGYGSGFIETSIRTTSLGNASYERYGVLHIKIDNLPAAVPQSTVATVSRIYPPYLIRFLFSMFGRRADSISENGLLTKGCNIIHPELRRHWEARL